MSATHPFAWTLLGHDPYKDFPIRRCIDDFGWNHLHPIFERLIEEVRPQLIVEVGSFKGGSALHMARLVKKVGIPNALIICVDTWLGGYGDWDVENRQAHSLMQFEHGQPTIHETFISNVILSGHEDVILPLRQTSGNAARILSHLGMSPDLTYLDASHEYIDVGNDLAWYWMLTRRGGVMFGDDYDIESYPGVYQAVNEFRDAANVEAFQTDGSKWSFRVPLL